LATTLVSVHLMQQKRLGIPRDSVCIGSDTQCRCSACVPLLTATTCHCPCCDFIFPLRRVREQIGSPQRPKNAPAEFLAVIVSNLLNLVTIHREFIPPAASGKPSVHRPNCFQMPRTTDDQPFGASLDPDTVLVSTTTSSTSDDGLFRHVLESVAQMEFP